MSAHASNKKSCITPFMDQNIDLNNIACILDNSGSKLFNHPDFTPGPENLNFLRNVFRVLVIGAGGLGCEILKNLALLSFSNIDLIDMDTIELSNLNRQFLFRETDIGKSKAEVAASYIKMRRPECLVTPYNNKIQDFDSKFYSKYHLVVCGLDSIVARRWINNMLVSLLKYDQDGNLDSSSVIPLVDGGTEGFKGNVRVIFPGITACLDCTLDLYPPQTTFPLCTIAHTPRLPEHCVEYVRMLQWDKDEPFGSDVAIDGDDPEHIKWIHERSCERANAYNIRGVTLSLTQGVIKRIVPAVASTNAVIAAVCANEAFKIATSCFPPINNFLFNDTDGVYCYNYQTEKKEYCLVCGQNARIIKATPLDHLGQIVDFLKQDSSYQMKSPGITTLVEGKRRTLYMEATKQLEAVTRPNLDKTLKELGLEHDTLIEVVDVTSPTSYSFRLSLVN